MTINRLSGNLEGEMNIKYDSLPVRVIPSGQDLKSVVIDWFAYAESDRSIY